MSIVNGTRIERAVERAHVWQIPVSVQMPDQNKVCMVSGMLVLPINRPGQFRRLFKVRNKLVLLLNVIIRQKLSDYKNVYTIHDVFTHCWIVLRYNVRF